MRLVPTYKFNCMELVCAFTHPWFSPVLKVIFFFNIVHKGASTLNIHLRQSIACKWSVRVAFETLTVHGDLLKLPQARICLDTSTNPESNIPTMFSIFRIFNFLWWWLEIFYSSFPSLHNLPITFWSTVMAQI